MVKISMYGVFWGAETGGRYRQVGFFTGEDALRVNLKITMQSKRILFTCIQQGDDGFPLIILFESCQRNHLLKHLRTCFFLLDDA